MTFVNNLKEIFAYLTKDRIRNQCLFRLFSILLMFVIFPFNLYSQSCFDFRPELYGIVSINEPWKKNNVPLNDKIYYYLTQRTNLSKRYTQVDSTSKKFVIGHRVSDFDIRIPQIIDIDNLIENRFKISNKDILLYRFTKNAGEKLQKSTGIQRRGVGFTIPMPTKSKILQNLIGSDINLKVTGSVSIKGNLIQKEQSAVKTNINQSSDYTFKLDQTQKFNIAGNIGRLARMNIDQDSQRQFDYLNIVNLNYSGKEDDIIQEFHAGNIGLSLPGTRFVTFSGNSQGLFGLKSSMKVGDFKFTSIASLEKGQKQKLSLQGGAQSQSTIIKDYEYVKGTYYFLDDYYRENFKYNETKTLLIAPNPERVITDLEVWKAGKNYHLSYPESRYGWALFDANIDKPGGLDFDTSGVEDQNNRRGNFIRLEQNKDYFVNKEFGYIIMNQRVMNEIIAVSYMDAGGRVRGTLIPQLGETLILKMIRSDDPRPSDKVWDLEWRNVYFLGRRNIDPNGLEINIIDNRSGTGERIQPGGKNYLEIFNLDRLTETGERRPDDKIDINNTNLFNFYRGELLFPSHKPFAPESGESTALLNEKRNPALYDTLFTNQSQYAKISKFDIEIKLASASASYDLGFNLLPSSEEITLGGQPLVKGKDYEIDYNTGRLQILNELALKPGADLDIKYENGEMFQLDKKTILGMRGEYSFLNNGFIGFTGLMLNERILEQRIKLEQEPIKNLVWDVNTRFNLEPNFITRALDFLPFIDTNAPSTLLFEGEVGQVLPNPNTINVGSMGDPNGVADLDNFEGSSLFTTIQMARKSWYRSSVPYFDGEELGNPAMHPRANKRGKLIWYNPWQQVQIKEIFPNKDVNTRTGTMTSVLILKRIDNSNYAPVHFDWWSGITTPLSTSYFNQNETRFIEFWIKGEKGSVHFDMGLINEDAISNGSLDTEDFVGGRPNGILDPGEDVGIDGIAGRDGTNPEEKFDDDWSYSFKSDSYDDVNGTEGNGSSTKTDGLLLPDTEDMNNNGVLDTRNDYFEYSFTLGRNHPDFDSLVVGGQDNPNGWRLYRIPINRVSKSVGNPDLTRIEYARIWIEELDIGEQIEIASINLAGNDWKEVGVSSNIDSVEFKKREGTIATSVINTEENEAEYESPPGVFGLEDRITGARQREQSLVFKYNNIVPGEAAAISKSFMKDQNAIHYKELKMFIHGNENITVLTDSTTDLMFFFRFGRDENSYFEIRQYIFPGWDERNELKVPLTKLSTIEIDFFETREGYPEWGEGKFYKMVGNPTSRQIRVVTAGIINKGNNFRDGEIWMDELRVSNVEKVKAIAMRTMASLKLADIGNLSGSLEKRDADFHNVNDRWGGGSNTLSYNLQGNFDLGRFISSENIFSIPIAFTLNNSESVPKYLTGKDILLEGLKSSSKADSLIERETALRKNSGFNFSFKKNVPSKMWLLRNTIDKITFSYAGTNSFMKDFNTQFNNNYAGSTQFAYSQNFNAAEFGLSPLGWIGENTFLIGKLSGLKFLLLPNSFSFNAGTSEKKSNSKLRAGTEKPVKSFNLSRNYALGFTPLNNLTVQINRSNASDMRAVKNKLSIFAGNFGKEVSESQTLTSSYQIRLFSWLTNRLNYNSNYSLNSNIQLPEAGRTATNKSQKQGDITINLAQMLGFSKSGSSKETTGRSNVRIRKPIVTEKKEEKDEEKKEGEEEKKGFFLLRGIGALINRINPIALKYSQTTDVQSVGLEDNPTFGYKFGFDTDPGVTYKANVGTNQGSVTENGNLSISSGLNLIQNIRTSLSYSKDNTTTERANTFTGNENETYLVLGDKKIPFFNWNVSLGGIEKWKFVRALFRTVSLSHAYNGSKVTQLQTTQNEFIPITEVYSSGFKPVAGITFNWKNGITSRVSWDIAENINNNLKVQSSNKTVQENISFTTNYSKSGGFSLPLPFLSSRRVNNNVDFRFTFSSGNNATFNTNPQGEYIKFSENSNWNVKQDVKYSFSSKISGGMYFELGKFKDKLTGERDTKDFGLSVDIIIAGG
ncbi:cell surface protein SprA [candidate division KSB1 bacterium]